MRSKRNVTEAGKGKRLSCLFNDAVPTQTTDHREVGRETVEQKELGMSRP
jgi:hypothetical protein